MHPHTILDIFEWNCKGIMTRTWIYSNVTYSMYEVHVVHTYVPEWNGKRFKRRTQSWCMDGRSGPTPWYVLSKDRWSLVKEIITSLHRLFTRHIQKLTTKVNLWPDLYKLTFDLYWPWARWCPQLPWRPSLQFYPTTGWSLQRCWWLWLSGRCSAMSKRPETMDCPCNMYTPHHLTVTSNQTTPGTVTYIAVFQLKVWRDGAFAGKKGLYPWRSTPKKSKFTMCSCKNCHMYICRIISYKA